MLSQPSVMNLVRSPSEELRRHEEKVRKNKEFLQNERNIEINRSNQALLNKLVEISTGKWSSVPHLRAGSIDVYMRHSSAYKSLNMPYRKRETERIERENHAFAKRLFERPPNLNKNKLDSDYKDHKKFVKLIQKMKGSQINGSPTRISIIDSKYGGEPVKAFSQGGVRPYQEDNEDQDAIEAVQNHQQESHL